MTQEQKPDAPKIAIPVALLQAIINYLEQRPYREVAGLIHGLLEHNPQGEK